MRLLTGCIVIANRRRDAPNMRAVLKHIPLQRRPFTVADARRAGLSWDDLQTRKWVRLSRGQYAWVGLPHDARLKLHGVAQRMPPNHAFSGLTAAWLLGLDVAWSEPIEVTI